MTAPPLFSVVIPAFSRERYLRTAVESVLSQQPEVDDFEILVVKNFANAELDAFLAEHGVRSLLFGSTMYGDTIARAVECCRGEVVAFLEDDDCFEPVKLARLRTWFDRSMAVGFYHNDYSEISQDGRGFPPSSQRRTVDRFVRGQSAWVLRGGRKVLDLPSTLGANPEAHLSCVAVRRDLLSDACEHLRHIAVGVDFFVFYAALCDPRAIVIDPAKLTRYRRHEGSLSRALSTDIRYSAYLRESSRVLAATTRAYVRERGSVGLSAMLEKQLALHRVYALLREPVRDRKKMAGALREVLRRGPPAGIRPHWELLLKSLRYFL